MGIRFKCPNGHALHVKNFLAGKRGVCPKCGVKVEIPSDSSDVDGVSAPLKSADSSASPSKTESAASRWYVRLPSGEQFGPISDSVFEDWVSEGRITADS